MEHTPRVVKRTARLSGASDQEKQVPQGHGQPLPVPVCLFGCFDVMEQINKESQTR